jgi:tetratricopeptide (TPR) repeat protein
VRAPKAQRPAPAASDHVKLGDALRGAGDVEGALAAYKRALGMLGPAATGERADIYVRLGQAKQQQEKRREAIASYEKALALKPAHRGALEALVQLNVEEGDWRAVQASEEGLLAVIDGADERFARLVEYGARWQTVAGDLSRARALFTRALEIRGDDLGVLGKLRSVHEALGSVPDVLAVRKKIAELTNEPRARAEAWFDLGKYAISELRREELGLEHLDRALESDPTMLEPLAVMARVLADRQEWSQLEQAYRRMLERVERIPKGAIRTEVTWELCRRLGILFREHLEDPGLALDAFEDAVHEKPNDLPTRLTAADLARSIGKHDRAAAHLEVAASLDPARVATFHELFEVFQKLRRPDQAYQAACATMYLRQADARERFIFEEHKPDGVLKPSYVLPADAWEYLRVHDRDTFAEAVLAAAAPAAIPLRLAALAAEGRLPDLDPATRQDPEKSTISIVRSFAWAARLLGVHAPAVYLVDEKDLALASVFAEEPTVFIGNKVLRGRSLAELAFFVGRHLTSHVGPHRMLLYYPSIEDLSACFLAAVIASRPEAPVPPTIRPPVVELARGMALRLSEEQRAALKKAVTAFEEHGGSANLGAWVAAVERCSTRAGYLLAADLEASASVLKSEPRGVLDADAKIGDLLAFAVSEDHHALRAALGVAIQP